MILEEGNIITLEDNLEYGLLLEAIIDDKSYFLAVKLDENEQATDVFKVLKEIKENDDTLVEEETDPLILNKVLEQYTILSEDEE